MSDAEHLPAVGGALGKLPLVTSIPDSVTYFFIKHVQKWMECPVCGEKLLFCHEHAAWCCDGCGFSLAEDEFLDGYVFWFCDSCDVFLNAQEGFDAAADEWTCAECGYVNGLRACDLVGACQDCGVLISDPDATVCKDCEAARLG